MMKTYGITKIKSNNINLISQFNACESWGRVMHVFTHVFTQQFENTLRSLTHWRVIDCCVHCTVVAVMIVALRPLYAAAVIPTDTCLLLLHLIYQIHTGSSIMHFGESSTCTMADQALVYRRITHSYGGKSSTRLAADQACVWRPMHIDVCSKI